MTILKALKNGQPFTDDQAIQLWLNTSKLIVPGVYESIRIFHGRPFRLDQHMERMKDSAADLALELPMSFEEIKRSILDIITEAEEKNQFVKIIATADNVVIISRRLEIDPAVPQQGIKVITFSGMRPHPGTKSLNTSVSHQAIDRAKEQGSENAILVDDRNLCTEGAFSNLFWVEKGKVYSSTREALPGITQKAVIDAAEEEHPVTISTIDRDHLYQADEVFLTSSRIDIAPVIQVDEKKIGNGEVGKITTELMKRFYSLAEAECKP